MAYFVVVGLRYGVKNVVLVEVDIFITICQEY